MRKLFIAFLLFAFSCSGSNAQNYLRGYRSVTFTDPGRSNRLIPTDLYYPADAAGTNVPLASGTAIFPVVVFGHGFSIGTSSYAKLADSLTKYGFIAAFPTTEGSLSPSHDNFGKDISFLCTAIIALNTDPASFLFQRINPKAAVGGHSMGGGCSFLAASTMNPVIKAIFNEAAAETTPSAITAASSLFIPALQFSGSSDCIVPSSTQLSMYNNLLSSCKTHIIITGATHCQYADNNATCVFGQITSGCNNSSINVSIVYGKLVSLLIPFLDFYLKDSCRRGIDYINVYNLMTGVSKQSTCIAPSCSTLPIGVDEFNGSYALGTVSLKWRTANEANTSKYCVEKSADGIQFTELTSVHRQPNTGQANVYTAEDHLPFSFATYYRLKIIDVDGRFSYSSVLHIATPDRDIALTRLYPNPANNMVNLEFESDKDQSINIRMLCADGTLFSQNRLQLKKGIQEHPLPLTKVPRGFYIIQVSGENGRYLQSVKLIRR